jgi:glycosyltransferase involved in cell wall biosynthesis
MISIIIPAYNEEALLDGTLAAITAAADTLGSPYEIIVVDDGSTDRTAEIARAHGARVVTVKLRHIAAARNAGAREASGDLLLFVDADTLITAAVLQGAVASVRAGAVGGGAGARQDSNDPPWGPAVFGVAAWLMRMAGWAAGCFMFVRADVFRLAGGFDEQYFASEEIHLSRAVKKHGRFVILRDKVITSGRKGRLFTGREVLWQFVRALWPANLKRRDRLGIWYGGQREKGGKCGSRQS